MREAADSILATIGRTPLVRLRRIEPGNGTELLAKLEFMNPGGSVKDRIALEMVLEAEAGGVLRPGMTIVEPTSGNTGIGLAMVAAVRGYQLIVVMPENMSRERRALLEWYGARVILTPAAAGMAGAVNRAEEVADAEGAWMPQQFQNDANPRAHTHTTAQEILEALDEPLDCFVAGVGTGGTLTGVGRVLRERFPSLEIVAVEPAGSPVLSGGQKGPHRIQGIGAGFVPQILDRSLIDRVVTITDEEAYTTARQLAGQEGIFVGPSSGAATAAALRVARERPGSRVLTILPDTGSRYLTLWN